MERSQEQKDELVALRRKVAALRRLKRAAQASPPRASARLRKALERTRKQKGTVKAPRGDVGSLNRENGRRRREREPLQGLRKTVRRLSDEAKLLRGELAGYHDQMDLIRNQVPLCVLAFARRSARRFATSRCGRISGSRVEPLPDGYLLPRSIPPRPRSKKVAEMRTRILIGALTLLFSIGVYADDHGDDDGDDDSRFRLAAGASVSAGQSPYVGANDSVEVLPRLFVQMGRFYLRGPALGVYLYGGEDLSVSAGISLDFADTHRGDSPQLADMAELDDVLLGEIELSYETDWGELDLSLAADISGTHDGYLAGLSYGYPLEVGRWQIEPEIGIEWHSAEVNRHYYGVGAADVLPARALYEPDAGMNYELGVTVTYPFAERHALSLQTSAEWLSAEVSDSPIVERDSLVSVGASYLYRF